MPCLFPVNSVPLEKNRLPPWPLTGDTSYCGLIQPVQNWAYPPYDEGYDASRGAGLSVVSPKIFNFLTLRAGYGNSEYYEADYGCAEEDQNEVKQVSLETTLELCKRLPVLDIAVRYWYLEFQSICMYLLCNNTYLYKYIMCSIHICARCFWLNKVRRLLTTFFTISSPISNESCGC